MWIFCVRKPCELPLLIPTFLSAGFSSPAEKLITVILGIVGFALMVAVVLITTVAKTCKHIFNIMTKNAFQNLSRTVAFN